MQAAPLLPSRPELGKTASDFRLTTSITVVWLDMDNNFL